MASEEVGRLVDTIRQWDRIDSSVKRCLSVTNCLRFTNRPMQRIGRL